MVVKSRIKFVKNLQQKKYRIQYKRFVAEGIKTVQELLVSDFKADEIYSTSKEFIDKNEHPITVISEADLKKMSGLRTPNTVLGVFYMPEAKKVDFSDWVVVLDDIRDPGNLGTIIRLCDWFGIQHLICSANTVDCYNPKVLQATMGSIARVNIVYENIEQSLKDSTVPVYGTFMEGECIYDKELSEVGILIMGNEANGISQEIAKLVDKKISIPQYGKETTESLNVATATAILLNEIRRGNRIIQK